MLSVTIEKLKIDLTFSRVDRKIGYPALSACAQYRANYRVEESCSTLTGLIKEGVNFRAYFFVYRPSIPTSLLFKDDRIYVYDD